MHIIIATDKNGGFSKDGSIPWDIKEDRKYFSRITRGNIVIMGRKTFETIKKPLSDRINIIVSRTIIINDDNIIVCKNYLEAMTVAEDIQKYKEINEPYKEIFIIGGLRLYQEALADTLRLQSIHLTKIYADYDCDLFMAMPLLDNYLYGNINCPEFSINHYIILNDNIKKNIMNVAEIKYLALIRLILTEGTLSETRNGSTLSIFSPPELKFNLLEGFPLLTTKKMFWRAIVEELIMFINGWTDANYLKDKGIHIWDGNTSADFHKSRGLDYKEGDMGPMYGWNWRHFSANYEGKDASYEGAGFDQLANLVNMITKDLTNCSRRLLITTFDPSKIAQSVLPPCHSLPVQFNIQGEFMDCKMTQRSADMFLGVPFNIASTALFMSLIAKLTGYTPRMLTLSFGDAHIYSDHIAACNELCLRKPYAFPRLSITKELHNIKNMEQIKFEDILLQDYNCHPAIKAAMVI